MSRPATKMQLLGSSVIVKSEEELELMVRMRTISKTPIKQEGSIFRIDNDSSYPLCFQEWTNLQQLGKKTLYCIKTAPWS